MPPVFMEMKFILPHMCLSKWFLAANYSKSRKFKNSWTAGQRPANDPKIAKVSTTQ